MNTFFANLDAKTMEEKSPQPMQQLKARVTNFLSSQDVLVCKEIPAWAIKPELVSIICLQTGDFQIY